MLPRRRKRSRPDVLVPTLVFLALMVSLISSLGAPLIPTIATGYGVSLSAAQWSLTLALLVGAVATPVLGRLGDGPRRRPALLLTVTAVFAGSLLAALPLGFGVLLVGRALQGLGLGLLPMVMAVARDHLAVERGRSAIALLSVTGVAGVGLGYPVTGLVAERAGLHGAFVLGAVLSGLALLLAAVVLPDDRTRPQRRLDVPGALLLGAGFAGLLVALAEGGEWGWGSARLLGLAAVSAGLLGTWVRVELRVHHPLVDLRLLRHRGVLLADLTALLSGIGMYLMMSMAIRLVQTPTSTGYGIGASVAVGGLVLVPMSVASVAASRLVPALARRASLGGLLPIGAALFGTAIVLFALGRGSLWQVMLVLAVVGLGIGITVSVMPALILASVPADETGSATGFNQVLRTAGYSTGSALSATLLEAHTRAGSALPTAAGYQVGAYVGIGLCVAIVGLTLALLPKRVPLPRDEELLRDEALADALGADDVPLARSSA